MENPYRNFYRNFYLRTGGFIPTKPFNQTIYPGDYFQIKNGEMIVLGNIFRNKIVDFPEIELGHNIKLNSANWNFSDGITKPYSDKENAHETVEGELKSGKHIIVFSSNGSFFFKGNNPESEKIMNWNAIQQQLIIKMTQILFSFRELYVVTETASTSDWTLAVSKSDKSELEIETDSENSGNSDAETIQSKEIEYYHRETKRKPVFFKAKKIIVLDKKSELDNFEWTDANLDDVEKMFLSQGSFSGQNL